MRNIWKALASAVMPAAAIVVLLPAGSALADEEGDSVPIIRQWDVAHSSGSGGGRPSRRPVPIIRQWDDAHSAQDTPRRAVARDVRMWASLWRAMQGRTVPLPELPTVDFQRHMVIGVFLGTRPTGGYSVRITGIVETNDRIVVTVRERAPDPGSIVIQVLTQPYHVVVVPRSEKPVVFIGPRLEPGPPPRVFDR